VRENNCHGGKAFGCFRRLQTLGHRADGFGRDLTVAEGVAAEAFFQLDVEEDGFADAAHVFGDLDKGAAVLSCEIGRVDVGHWGAQGDSHADEVSHQAEDQAVDGLVGCVVAEPAAELVGGDRYSALLRYPCRLSTGG